MIEAVPRTLLALGFSMAALPALAGGDPAQLPPSGERVTYVELGAVRLTIDFASLLVLDRPASTIIVGNTAIAAATLSDDRTLILMGRTAGSTNLIVLDEEGEEIENIVLEVVAGGTNLVTVHQGLSRQTFTCASRCDPVLSVGDDAEAFGATASQISARHSFTDAGAGQ